MIYLYHMKLFDLVTNIILENYQLDLLVKHLVGEPQLGDKHGRISKSEFDTIMDHTNGKFAYTAWLVKNIVRKHINFDDVKKFIVYFKVFEKYKSLFTHSDINQYKTLEDINDFVSTAKKIIQDFEKMGENGGESNFISPTQIKKLESEFGIKLIGLHDGYQVFLIPKELEGNEDAWKAYRNTFGQCKDGNKLSVCTFASVGHFNNYLGKGPLFVIFKLSDPQSPYQLSFESGEFRDRENKTMIQ